LYDFISSFKPKGKLLDVGCGVGIISLLLTRDFNIQTSIIDKQEKMLTYAKHNFALNNLDVKSYLGDFTRYAHHLPIEDFIANVKKLLKPRGYFIFCYDAKQVDLLLHHLTSYGITVETMQFVHSKIDRESKLVMIAARMGSKSMTRVLPPFIVFDDNNVYRKKAMEAFEKANTNSIKGDL
jgi:tRNA1(Val) A37 N6-methylase TrmN6